MAKDRVEEQRRNPRRARRRNTAAADWAACDAMALQRAIATVAATGGALRLGYTRDGGAYAVGVYGDGDPYTEYVRPSEDISAYMMALAEDFAA